eukprot:5745449-Pyramimonas_sp.AAC.1
MESREFPTPRTSGRLWSLPGPPPRLQDGPRSDQGRQDGPTCLPQRAFGTLRRGRMPSALWQ